MPAQQILGSAELQNLRGVLTDDALRAVQVLPGVATGDDFRSEFSVRGSDFSHLNFTVDGFATPFVMHMVRAVEERANTGSVSMINSDVLESVSLSNGGYPQRSGNRTGAEVGFVVREGSRDRTLVRASVSGTAASMTVEGPLGSAHRGSWLISGRKSYLDLLVRKLREEGLLRFRRRPGEASARRWSESLGGADLPRREIAPRELPEQVEDTDLFTGDNASAIAIGSWRTAFRRGVCCRSSRRDEPLSELQPDGYRAREGRHRHRCGPIGPYASARHACGPRIGVLVEHINETQRKQRPPVRRSPFSTTIVPLRRGRAHTRGCDSTWAAG